MHSNRLAAAKWAQQAATELRSVAEAVSVAPEPEFLGEEAIRFDQLRDEALVAIDRLASDGRIDRDRCIYTIELDGEADPEKVLAAFKVAKKTSNLKLPRDNKILSFVLYVGSSCATKKRKLTLRTRLRQHLLTAHNGTFGLSLAEWTEGLHGGISVKAWQYPAISAGEDMDVAARRVVLAVEDWLASQLKPMLGSRGIRN